MPQVQVNEIPAASALAFFKSQKISVQEAKPIKAKGEDGRERPGFKTENVALAEAHILSAKDYGDRVTIITIDGRRYEAAKKAA